MLHLRFFYGFRWVPRGVFFDGSGGDGDNPVVIPTILASLAGGEYLRAAGAFSVWIFFGSQNQQQRMFDIWKTEFTEFTEYLICSSYIMFFMCSDVYSV